MNPFGRFFRTPWTGALPIVRLLPTQDSTTQKRGHTSMLRAGFEPTMSEFEHSKTIRVLDGGDKYYLGDKIRV
jgi:hypothetical protein